MALSKFHITVALLAAVHKNGGDIEAAFRTWKKEIPFVVLPDAIRCFKYQDENGEPVPNNRVLSHFEINPFTGKASWMEFPGTKAALKAMVDTSSIVCHYEGDYQQVAIGDETSIDAFIEHNSSMEDQDIYNGCYMHLIQDRIYDAYIREVIDASKRRENGEFYFAGKTYDAKSVRGLIGEIEEFEFRTLCKLVYEETGITVDATFFEEYVKPALYAAYSENMAANTWKYISFNDKEIPEYITEAQALSMIRSMVDGSEEVMAA